ncbi:MAG: hypothetical protein KAG34_09725 [Cocleimonas sp.]|nr:hypothetical protein [Cocleimonas sp.]
MFYINAWLDCTHPQITIHNRLTHEVCVHFSAAEIDVLFASGEVTLDELSSSDANIQQDLLKALFLSRIMINFTEQLGEIKNNLGHRNHKITFPKNSSFPRLLVEETSSSMSLETSVLYQPLVMNG